MKNRTKLNPFLRIVILVSALLLASVVLVIGMFYYIFGITEPEGLSMASWPARFTANFSLWMENEDGNIKIEEIGLRRLDEYGLWLQVLDEAGQEVFCHNKPETRQTSYSASELIALQSGAYHQGSTVFVNSCEISGKTWSYLIGFPYVIGKYMLYYNGTNVSRLSPVFRMGIFFVLCAVVLLTFCYGFWLTKHLGKITGGIGDISRRAYTPLPEKGLFSKIYGALNQMDEELRRSDQVQKDTDRIRREWIANITHDLKTPLSPIKGYGELLTGTPSPDQQDIQEYGMIILRNIDHTEKMINDLKLIYQLDSGAALFRPQKVMLVRFLRELVIDIINDPAFQNRNIAFESRVPELELCLDPDLFRRAVNNLVINALTHNPPETKVEICVDSASEQELSIIIADNGAGISPEEQAVLFNRYYRGTSTKEKPEGSGLGLAIAKQIITLHGGNITVSGSQGKGTRFTVLLPYRKPAN